MSQLALADACASLYGYNLWWRICDKRAAAEYNCTHSTVTFTTTQQSMTRLPADAYPGVAGQDDSPSLVSMGTIEELA